MREIDIVDNEILRILFAMPETAGDIFISTGVCAALKNKFPNSTIYFATKPEYYQILEGCPHIDGVIEYTEAMLNYRNFETWGNTQHLFDIVYNPNIITQKIPHWIHRGKGPYLGDAYAHMCNVAECLDPYIRVDDVSRLNLPEKFITIHSQTRQDPKDYDYMQKIIDNIKDIPIVQIGGSNDNKLNNIALDLRGQTTPQELAGVFKRAMMHIGLDSFPMHVAVAMETPIVAMFGGTYMKQGLHPRHKGKIFGLETQDRGPCVTSCHLVECLAKQIGIDKCINNIPVEDVLDAVREIVGPEHVTPEDPIKISSYIIIKDGIKYGFPFEKCIAEALRVSDEVVVVDGGSTDLTYEQLLGMGQPSGLAPGSPEYMRYIWNNVNRLKILQHKWDMDNPTLFGDEKTYARQKCTGNWLIQLDADEIIHEPYPGAIRDLIKKNRSHDGMDLPCINFYRDEDTIRIEQNAWKWRITRNDPNIIHGVHAEAQVFDQDAMRISMDKTKSDSCEYIYADSMKFIRHKPAFPVELLRQHIEFHMGKVSPEKYNELLCKIVNENCVVFHYSWFDLKRKENNGAFWDDTFHGKKELTHNTTKDIKERVEANKDKLIKVTFYHPMRSKDAKTANEQI
jgi:ADP-heptose:LPS heptosyltransferase/glycosyltransferase involved in cell wall biosynthesis